MRCSKCDSDNREGRKFCTSCGTALIAVCPRCGAPTGADERFCGECGTALGRLSSTKTEQPQQAAPSIAGERRHLTVMFCYRTVAFCPIPQCMRGISASRA